ncbi:MAG: glycosyltransferase [Acidimicrobiia bacterium]|nr:glycosyltransferase [Acidimicrobiia bacterium]
MSPLPLVTIVTPSFNMARFLEETIESVLSQDYPHIDYIVVDGGSTDGTQDLLRRHEHRLRWISEKDDGQADAINKGFRMARGEIFAYLNADDTYLPGAISSAVSRLEAEPSVGVVYGEAWYVREDGSIIRRYPTDPYDYGQLGSLCYICQPASFIRSAVFAEAGMMDTKLHLTLDYDLWLRISQRHRMLKIDEYLATSRMYADNKTLGRRVETFREVVQITKRHRGYVPLNWLYGYAGHILDRKDGFYEHSQPSLIKYALTLAMGAWYNPLRFPRFFRECTQSLPMAMEMLWKKWRQPRA